MKILVINGSPRQGNTKDLLNAFIKGVNDAEISYYDLSDTQVQPCDACDACSKSGGKCKHKDATNEVLNKILDADAIVFGTPVYWWGISAQLKAVIDKMYAFNGINYNIPNKKIGLITVGAMQPGAMQYQLISNQFKCISDFLKWDIRFDEAFSAYNIGDVANDSNSMEKCANLYAKLI